MAKTSLMEKQRKIIDDACQSLSYSGNLGRDSADGLLDVIADLDRRLTERTRRRIAIYNALVEALAAADRLEQEVDRDK